MSAFSNDDSLIEEKKLPAHHQAGVLAKVRQICPALFSPLIKNHQPASVVFFVDPINEMKRQQKKL